MYFYIGPVGENPVMLSSCYKNCLELVVQYNIKSIVLIFLK